MMLATQTLYDWLLFLHVLAAMVWLGGGVMLSALATRVLRDPDPGVLDELELHVVRVLLRRATVLNQSQRVVKGER